MILGYALLPLVPCVQYRSSASFFRKLCAVASSLLFIHAMYVSIFQDCLSTRHPPEGRQVQIPGLLRRFLREHHCCFFLDPSTQNEQRVPFAATSGTYPASFSEVLPTMASMHLREEPLSLNDPSEKFVRKNLLWECQVITLRFLF